MQREDDRAETVIKRLEVYQAQTRPLIEFYERLAAQDARAPRLLKISGLGGVEDVSKRAIASLS